MSQQLVKAKLVRHDGDANTITFMFNPTEISFTKACNWQSDPGNRGETLLPKVTFSGVEPYKFTLSKLVFDTYETKKSVMDEYIKNIEKGVTAPPKGDIQRPPVYIFTWDKEYFYCVMTSLTYNLTMFLANGTPVRALVDISLQEVDHKHVAAGKPSANSNRSQDGGLAPTTK